MADPISIALVGSAAASATATTAAVAATSGLIGSAGLVGGFASFGSILTGISAISSIAGGIKGNQQANMQAKQAELTAKQEELKGRDQAAQIRLRLNSALASQNAIFGARGINPASGTPQSLAAESSNEASRDISIAQFGAGQSAAALRSQAKQYKIQGASSLISGFGTAGTNAYTGLK